MREVFLVSTSGYYTWKAEHHGNEVAKSDIHATSSAIHEVNPEATLEETSIDVGIPRIKERNCAPGAGK